ncbi:hypothetical protein BMT55_06920 [Listeria newyorkensis]|uniref:DUF1304 domain-containing protein n=1 Tax=Listeria newyorkensis TaxID=1497681 RepID=A0ABX4XNA0_9LIST|nr:MULTISPECIES: DUF1304 domain-containing protein [Listeria]KGL42284.1 membrane protein [Listeriaceae bacterium FSL A5-0209]KGL38714.1 membrane protein [Listeria newyorkensis]PNP92687.1 hypothetical protein BMT55_06920 [Listeria newyorkensis]RQW66484.1 DUF1304 domain-containing protein [Listeria sp. SHR_NRA_18]WAO23110.1 DUF1304 domain-containing protein [Listeria newyorkensis]
MAMLTTIFILIVALLHFYIMYFEMFAFTKPRTLKTFNMTKEKAENGKELAANQGLYNGFLAAGLVWSVLYPDPAIGLQIAIFFLSCVVIAALYGAATVSKRIFFAQGMPAIIALILTIITM